MTYKTDGENYLVRVAKGERLGEALDKFMSETKIEGGWVNGIGASSNLTIGTYTNATKDYNWTEFNSPLEITGLIGNLAVGKGGKMMFHIHGTFAGPDFKTIAGHVKDLTVNATLELLIQPTKQSLKRQFDEDTGLQLLDLG